MTETIGILDCSETEAPSETDGALAHVTSAVPKGARGPECPMTRKEMERARELFSGLSDNEIHNLYKKVTR